MISDELTRRMFTAMREGAIERGLTVVLCVVDARGDLVAFERMLGVGPISIDLAQRKASTAALWRMPTAELKPLVQPGAPLYGVTHLDGGRYLAFGGGLPLLRDAVVVGGVGVSGSNSVVDAEIADLGRAAFDAA